MYTWNRLIIGYAKNGLSSQAMLLLRQIKAAGLTPNTVSWTSLAAAIRWKETGRKRDEQKKGKIHRCRWVLAAAVSELYVSGADDNVPENKKENRNKDNCTISFIIGICAMTLKSRNELFDPFWCRE